MLNRQYFEVEYADADRRFPGSVKFAVVLSENADRARNAALGRYGARLRRIDNLETGAIVFGAE